MTSFVLFMLTYLEGTWEIIFPIRFIAKLSIQELSRVYAPRGFSEGDSSVSI